MSALRRKEVPLSIKNVSDEGVFEGFASVFDKVDLQGDVVERGAFAESLRARKEIPVLWQHDRNEPIGIIDSAEETDRGLHVRGRLVKTVTRAREVLDLMKAGALRGLSIGYRIVRDSIDRATGHRRRDGRPGSQCRCGVSARRRGCRAVR